MAEQGQGERPPYKLQAEFLVEAPTEAEAQKKLRQVLTERTHYINSGVRYGRVIRPGSK